MRNYFRVFRYPGILLVGLFLVAGPTPFERIHLAEVSRFWAQRAALEAKTLAGGTPLQRMPAKAPVHDPSTCPICIALHAAVTVQHTRPRVLTPLVRLGYCSGELVRQCEIRLASPLQCRGPPLV